MAWQLGVFQAVAEDTNLAPSTHVGAAHDCLSLQLLRLGARFWPMSTPPHVCTHACVVILYL